MREGEGEGDSREERKAMPLPLVVVCERRITSAERAAGVRCHGFPLSTNAVHTACPAISFAFASRPPKMIGRTLHRLCTFYRAVCAVRASAPGPAQKLIISGSGSSRAREGETDALGRVSSWNRECVFTAANPCARSASIRKAISSRKRWESR